MFLFGSYFRIYVYGEKNQFSPLTPSRHNHPTAADPVDLDIPRHPTHEFGAVARHLRADVRVELFTCARRRRAGRETGGGLGDDEQVFASFPRFLPETAEEMIITQPSACRDRTICTRRAHITY